MFLFPFRLIVSKNKELQYQKQQFLYIYLQYFLKGKSKPKQAPKILGDKKLGSFKQTQPKSINLIINLTQIQGSIAF